MKTKKKRIRARDYIADLAAAGRYHFCSGEACEALGVSADAARLALNRLARQHLVATPARGFYVIVPPEYRSLGCLPADQFIPELMGRLNLSYYAGLLTAAQYHGAAHHRPQEFQVFLSTARRFLECGPVRVAFITRKRLGEVPVQRFNTPRGVIHVSTPEATAVDLVGYHHHASGLDQVATILSELAERIDSRKLVAAAKTAPVTWAQRLGYLLERVGAGQTVGALKKYVEQASCRPALLLNESPGQGSHRAADWNLIVNADVEAEL